MMLTEEASAGVKDYMRLVADHPIRYARNVLNVDLWEKQREIMRAIADPSIPAISVRSGNGVGKTHLAASAIFQYLDSHAPGYAIISSSSWRQASKAIWPLTRRMYRDANVDLGGDMLNSEWNRGDLWGAFCVSPKEPENFSGFRTKHGALVVIDEASALEQEVYDAIRGLCSTHGSKILLIGNPLRTEGPFYETFGNAGWANFHISSEEVVDLGIPGLATREWIDSMALEWGVNSPMYKARVLGQFPEGSSYSLVQLGWVPARTVPKPLRPKGKRMIGVDVARYGDDRTVLLMRDARCVQDVEVHEKQSTMVTTGQVIKFAEKHHVDPEEIYVDDTGLGGGVTDRLEELEIYAVPINNGEQALERDKFANTRAESYWQIRERSIPDAPRPFFVPKQYSDVLKECTWPRYKLTSSGQIALESKDAIKARRGRSPDKGDALALTFANNGKGFEIAA